VRVATTEPDSPPLSDSPIAIREINQLRILNALRSQPGLSRAALVRQTGLGKATVSTIVAGFIARGLVREEGPEVQHAAGRRPTRLELNGEAFVVIGVELTGYECIAALIDLRGRPLRVLHRPMPESSPQSSVDTIVAAISHLMAGRDDAQLAGVGVGIPGVVDAQAQRVVLAQNIGWVDVPFARLLQDRISKRVSIINRTNADALGEYWHGSGQAADSMIYVSVGMGIGAGIIIGGKLHQGANGSAGEIGHVTVVPNGPRCACGNTGCLETLASTSAMVVRAKQRIKEGERSVLDTLTGGNLEIMTGSMITDAARQGDEVAVAVIQEAGNYLGVALANAINLLNPRLVVVDSEMRDPGDLFLESVRKAVNHRAFSLALAAVEVVPSRLEHLAAAIGASTLIIDQLFSSIDGLFDSAGHVDDAMHSALNAVFGDDSSDSLDSLQNRVGSS